MSKTRIIDGMSAVIDCCDGVILDLWGVIHDGEKPYPGVIDCLERLRAAGKATCLLSNAPRRIGGVVAKLEGMGIPRSAYDHVMTSGEAAYEVLRDEAALTPGRRLYHIGPERDRDVYLGLDIVVVDDPTDADFVLNTGIDDFDETLDDYKPRLDACFAAGLPMVCANPDLVVMVGPKRVICAGTLTQYYEGLGGTAVWHGKPFPSVYRRCMKLLGAADPARVIAVGDSLRTDIAGAGAAGMASVLVAGGIHLEELGAAWGEPVNPDKLEAAIEKAGERPTALLPAFVW
jgi:HAD superfamily hydrolase (TIGR01459 family)